MNTRLILGTQGDTLGIEILERDLSLIEPTSAARLVAEFGLVVIKHCKTPISEYNDWQLSLGYHQAADIWCNLPEFPIFFRVTNLQITENDHGLFGHGELDWHCNILFTPDGEEIVGLYGKTCAPGADTIIANSIPLWKNLSAGEQDLYANTWLSITNEINETYEKKLAHYTLPTDNLKDFDKKRAKLSIKNALNFDSQNSQLYPTPRFLKKNLLRLKPSHPLGIDGLYFPHLNLHRLTDVNGRELIDHQEQYLKLKANYIDTGRYVYSHNWEPGDIILMDQLTTIHKRAPLDPQVTRELLRTACWYKTNLRTQFGHSI